MTQRPDYAALSVESATVVPQQSAWARVRKNTSVRIGGIILMVLVVVAMLPWFAGLVVVGPVLGHASWHAYRAAVRP